MASVLQFSARFLLEDRSFLKCICCHWARNYAERRPGQEAHASLRRLRRVEAARWRKRRRTQREAQRRCQRVW